MCRNRLTAKSDERSQTEEAEKSGHIGDGGHEYRRRDRRIDSETIERDRNEDSGEPGGEIVDDHRRAHHRTEQEAVGGWVEHTEDQRHTAADEQTERQAV